MRSCLERRREGSFDADDEVYDLMTGGGKKKKRGMVVVIDDDDGDHCAKVGVIDEKEKEV